MLIVFRLLICLPRRTLCLRLPLGFIDDEPKFWGSLEKLCCGPNHAIWISLFYQQNF